MSEFGDRFKKARQSRGMSLDQISSETRIGIRFLQAIENEDFNLLPGGIFNRGFIRSFAEHVGIDAEQALVEYERLVGRREPVEESASTTPQATDSHKTQKRLLPIAVGVLLLVFIIVFGLSRQTQNSVVQSQEPVPGEPPILNVTPPPPRPAEPTPAKPSAPPASPDGLAVEMEIHEPTWIKLVSDGNELVSGEVLQPGTTRRYTAQASMDITIGNAGGLILKVNDRDVGSLGRSGQVREVNITPQNLNDIFG
jgi:hypothetical protein